MKKLAIAMASIFTVIAPVAHAAYDRYGNWYDEGRYSAPVYAPPPPREEFARVLDSRPVYADSGRHEECWNPRAGHYEERRETHDSNVNGTVAGAVVGGVVGHQFDNGSAGATLGGALLGGLIGNKVDKEHNSNPQDDLDYSRCRVVGDNSGRNLQGYDVRYEYRGQEYTTRMAQAPGRNIRVNESGAPLY